MPGWMLVAFFLFGYVASSYHLPSLFYQQLIAVPDMSHKLLLASAAVGLTLGYILLIFVPLSRVAQRECERHNLAAGSSDLTKGGRVFSLEPGDEDEDDEDEDAHAGKWNHVFTRRRGSF